MRQGSLDAARVAVGERAVDREVPVAGRHSGRERREPAAGPERERSDAVELEVVRRSARGCAAR
ncbi:hypothetical protein F01_70082 [Burkholderia cenocepacia]|nr:hypothetical protein F01_70082 [Burkholderia cenocepacia]